MAVPVYNKDKYYRIMDRTQSNYANQLKRLSKDDKRADFILIYYSIALIVYALSVEFYPDKFNATWTSYTSIILSVVVLMYSIINSKAAYPERIAKIDRALNEVKRLKREVGALPDVSTFSGCANQGSCQCDQAEACKKLENLKEEYDHLVSGTEIRDDLDFYWTIYHLCNEYGLSPFSGKVVDAEKYTKVETIIIEEIRGYISENNPRVQRLHVILRGFWHLCLYLAPIVIFLISLYSSNNSWKSLLFFCELK